MNPKSLRPKYRKWYWGVLAVTIIIFLVIGITATTFGRAPTVQLPPPDELPPIDLTGFGTKDQPTTDISRVKEILEQIAPIPSPMGTGWVHLVTDGYVTPPETPHPLYSTDGYQTVEQWIYINAAGVNEKSLITITDSDGQILQQSACGEGVCGNISKAALAEFDNEKLAIPFNPVPYSINSASSLIQEVSASNAQVKAWVDGYVLYIDVVTSNSDNSFIQETVPTFQGNQIVMGIDTSNGVMVYYSLYKIMDGEPVLDYEDKLVTYEFLDASPDAEQAIKDIVTALKARDGVK